MSYPGDPAAQQPQQYYQDGSGYPTQPHPGGYPDPNYPQSAPPVSGTPYPAGQYPAQHPAAPYSGAPYSAAPYSGPPMATQPVSGPATGPGPATPGGRNRSTIVFAGLTVLLLLVTVVLGVLYGTRTGDYNDAKSTVATRDAELAALRADLDKAKADLQKTQTDLADSDRALKAAQGDTDELKRQKQVIANCINLLVEAGRASSAGDTATAARKDAEADKVCAEAFKYLGI
jgi:hypothetical protein